MIIKAIAKYASNNPTAIALDNGKDRIKYDELSLHINKLATYLYDHNIQILGILLDNSLAWAIADLATIKANIICVPLPSFFSDAQLQYILRTAGIQAVLTADMPNSIQRCNADKIIAKNIITIANQACLLWHCTPIAEAALESLPKNTAKITFTSGTTGEPKAVCLSVVGILQVVQSLQQASKATHNDRHLCLMPLSVLLENIGGLYVCLLAGARCLLPALASLGMQGASKLDVKMMVASIKYYAASTCIMIPQMLQALLAAYAAGTRLPSLRFVAVGGATISPILLKQAAALAIPVFEGYGLSETCSVVTLNTQQDHRIGSVGKVLAHAKIRIANDGEILVKANSSMFLGYLQTKPAIKLLKWLPTGDMGYIDESGFLYLTGRKKHIFITAFGRNISPEWIESELLAGKTIAQAVVFGEARPFNIALLVAHTGASKADITDTVVAANKRLPDYARIAHWFISSESWNIENGLYTATARPRRVQLAAYYAKQITMMYENNK